MKLKLFILIFTITLFSCDDEESTKTYYIGLKDYIMIDSIDYKNEYSIQIYQKGLSKKTLIAGYNELYFAFFDYKTKKFSENVNYQMNVYKLINFDTLYSGYLVSEKPNGLSLYYSPIYFSEFANEISIWNIDLNYSFEGHNGKIQFKFDEVDSGFYIDTLRYENRLFQLILVEPINPKIGIRTIEFAIHEKIGKKYFPVVNLNLKIDLKLKEFIPPGIVNPISMNEKLGHYQGTINLSEVGEWNLKLTAFELNKEIFSKDYLFYPKN